MTIAYKNMQQSANNIDTLLELIGSEQLLEKTVQDTAEQIKTQFQALYANLPVAIQNAINDETKQWLSKALKNPKVTNLTRKFYEKHFSAVEISQLVAFYQSPVGKKFSRVTPLVFQEITLPMQEHIAALMPELQLRINQLVLTHTQSITSQGEN